MTKILKISRLVLVKLRATWEAGAKIGRQVSHDLDHYMLIKIIFRLLFWIRWRLLLFVTSASWWSMLMRFVLETMRTMRRTSMTCSRLGLTAVWQRGPLQVRIHCKQRKTCLVPRGEFVDGKFHGQGSLTWESGHTYTGANGNRLGLSIVITVYCDNPRRLLFGFS